MIPVDHHTYAQTHKPRWKVIYVCFCIMIYIGLSMKRASSWDYGTSRTSNQRRLRRACTSAQSCQGHKCSHTRNVDEGACLKLGSPQQLLAFRYEKNGRKSLSFTVRVYLNLQLRFFTQFREKLFSMQTTKAQISQRICAVLPIISA